MDSATDVRTLENQFQAMEQKDLDSVKKYHSERQWPHSPYPCDKDINQRVVLYWGNIESLRAEMIVNPTNEHLTQLDYVSKLAGPELEHFVRKKIRYCPTGEAQLSPGFASNFKYIIHAVPPKYKSKYKTAAETALYHAYFRVIETMIERKVRTCVVPMLKTTKDNLPLEDHIHIQLRLIRRILEKKRQEFDRIVLHIDDDDDETKSSYTLIYRCYFPCCDLEEETACYVIDCDALGGLNGEPVIPERQIRIRSKPAALSNFHQESIDLKTGLDLSTVVGKTAFSKMRDLNDFLTPPPSLSSSKGHSKSSLDQSPTTPTRKRRSRGQQQQYCAIL